MSHEIRLPHLNVTFGETDGRCHACQAETVPVTADAWHTHPADDGPDEFVEPRGEVSGHYCRTCSRLTAVFLNDL